jgi:hypothetical protein
MGISWGSVLHFSHFSETMTLVAVALVFAAGNGNRKNFNEKK